MCGYVGSEAQLYSEAIIDTGHTGFVKTAVLSPQPYKNLKVDRMSALRFLLLLLETPGFGCFFVFIHHFGSQQKMLRILPGISKCSYREKV